MSLIPQKEKNGMNKKKRKKKYPPAELEETLSRLNAMNLEVAKNSRYHEKAEEKKQRAKKAKEIRADEEIRALHEAMKANNKQKENVDVKGDNADQ